MTYRPKSAATLELQPDVLVEEGYICDILVFLCPELSLEVPSEHLHVQEMFKEALLIIWSLLFVLREIEACVDSIDSLDIGAHNSIPWLDKVLLVVLEHPHEELEKCHSYLFDILMIQSLLLVSPCLYNVFHLFR